MLKELLLIFLKDRIILILFFIINMVCMLLFFHLSEPANNEFAYPFLIGMFLLAVFLMIDWIRFYPANRAIAHLLRNQGGDLQPHTYEQKLIQELLHKINLEHSHQFNMLKEQNKERFYFFSHWMHHLKTPVSVVELILQNEEKTEIMRKIQQENERLNTSIEQGLTMIRMDRFENDMEVQSIDLVSSLRKLINRRKKEWIYHSIFPSIEYEENEAMIITDLKWNEILIDQIISNAIKYSTLKDGSKRLVFQIKRKDERVYLSIIDEGVGIPDYDLERVFDAFFTGENGRKVRNATGIGLYLSKKIADRLEARISIQSKSGEGTIVTIGWLTGKKYLTKM